MAIPLSAKSFELQGEFYLGKDKTESPFLIRSSDLVTHGAILGMTGSGKTGLALALLEEAAIDGYPAIVVDPKGDLGNLMLQFPNLSPEEFAPWTDDPEGQAALWQKGLAEWGQTEKRIRMLIERTDLQILTPGSTKGRPVALLGRIAPLVTDDRDERNRALAAEATALLTFAGIDPDRAAEEFLLLTEVIGHAWDQEDELSIEDLVGRILDPPFEKIGVLALDAACPEKKRRGLAVALNQLIASPTMEAWRTGPELDIDSMLRADDGRPRVTVLTIAHLNDAQRMFFLTNLLNRMVGWMRRQVGTSDLRALLYIDEVYGYLPPVSNPPTKQPLLLLLKQARAFGLGVVLASQNPVDLDYKALSNIGTWMLGRLQTERDVLRVVDGLKAAAAERGIPVDDGKLRRLLAGLNKRHFLVRTPGHEGYTTIQSRWCLSYLRGPMTLDEIAGLSPPGRFPAGDAPAEDDDEHTEEVIKSVTDPFNAELLEPELRARYDTAPPPADPVEHLLWSRAQTERVAERQVIIDLAMEALDAGTFETRFEKAKARARARLRVERPELFDHEEPPPGPEPPARVLPVPKREPPPEAITCSHQMEVREYRTPWKLSIPFCLAVMIFIPILGFPLSIFILYRSRIPTVYEACIHCGKTRGYGYGLIRYLRSLR